MNTPPGLNSSLNAANNSLKTGNLSAAVNNRNKAAAIVNGSPVTPSEFRNAFSKINAIDVKIRNMVSKVNSINNHARNIQNTLNGGFSKRMMPASFTGKRKRNNSNGASYPNN
jgi:hypothetical protein